MRLTVNDLENHLEEHEEVDENKADDQADEPKTVVLVFKFRRLFGFALHG